MNVIASIPFRRLGERGFQERAAKEAKESAFVTYRQQLGFGVHVLVMMGTLYAVGHAAIANTGYSPALVKSPTVTS